MNYQPMPKMTRFFGSAVFAVVLLFGAGALSPQVAQAASLTSDQISAIIGLLQSFGADQTTINNVQISLNGGTPTGGGTQAWCHTFNSDLTVGSTGADVSALNRALSSSGIDTTGNSSSFTENTAGDVVQFQAKYGIRQTGYVGPITRARLNKLYGCSNPVPPSTFSASPTSGSAPLAVMFYSNTQGGIVDFGDGTPSAQMECDNISTVNSSSVSSACLRTFTSHTYATPGIYTATLQVLSPCAAHQNDPTFSSSSCFPVTIGKVAITVTGGTGQPLTVLSPIGGEQWQKGTTKNIKWSATPSSVSSVSISLERWLACLHTYPSCEIAIRPYTLTASTQNDGVFEWTVGKDAAAGDIPAGQYTVTVSGGAFSDSSDAPFSIVVPGTTVAPTITFLQPTSGPVGTSVTITGTGFTLNKTGSGCEGNTSTECAAFSIPSNTVRFGPVTIENVESYDGKTLYFQVPSQYMPPCPAGMACAQVMSQVGPGMYNVSVSNANGASNAVNFTVTSKTGTLSINPTSAGIKVGGTTEFQALFDNCPSGAQCFVGPLPVRATWTSSNSKVASVAYKDACPSGAYCIAQQFDYLTAVATGVSLGSATITATYKDSSGAVFTASAPVSTVMQ